MKKLIISESQYNRILKEQNVFQNMMGIANNLINHHGGMYFGSEGEALKKMYSQSGDRTGDAIFTSAIKIKDQRIHAKLVLDEYGITGIYFDDKPKYERPDHISKMIEKQNSDKEETPIQHVIHNGPEDETLEEEFRGVLENFNEVIKAGRMDRLNEINDTLKQAQDYDKIGSNDKQETPIENLFLRFFSHIQGDFSKELDTLLNRTPEGSSANILAKKLVELGQENKCYLYGEPILAIKQGDQINQEYTTEDAMNSLIDFYYENLA